MTTVSPSGAGELRCELVRLAAGDEGAALPSLIAGLLLPDLPVFLLLRLDPERWEPLVKACWSFATRVVVDSTGERSGLHSLPGLLAREPTRSVTDLSWTKLTGWRELVARLFDPPTRGARSAAPRPHRADARGPLRGPGTAARGLDAEQDASAPERGADERAAPGHALGLAHLRRPDLRQGALRGRPDLAKAWPSCASPYLDAQQARLWVPHLPMLVAEELGIYERDEGFEAAVAELAT